MIPIKILLLEDNPNDAELLLYELRRGGFEPSWQRVDTEADFDAALQDSFELILADYQLPQFDGMRALDMTRARRSDTPFILVSGTIGEELAVEAMKKGAADYLLKDRLTRLGQAVQHALTEKRLRAEKERADEQVRASEERFRAITETASDAILSMDAKGKIVFWNRAAEKMFGYAVGEALGMSLGALYPERFRSSHKESIAMLDAEPVSGPIGKVLEVSAVKKDGTEFPAEVSKAGWQLQGQVFYTAIVRDITERKRAEETLKAQLQELQRWYDTTLHREDRILELKREVNALLKSMNQPPRYPSAEA